MQIVYQKYEIKVQFLLQRFVYVDKRTRKTWFRMINFQFETESFHSKVGGYVPEYVNQD
jgi:hypothetical protein